MKFVCVGIDVRTFPCKGFYSADSAEWERDNSWYERLLATGIAMENEYGLLAVKDQGGLDNICKEILSASVPCDLAAVELPLEIVQSLDIKWSFQTSSTSLNLSNFTCHGFDICDFNGLITLFNNPSIAAHRYENGLIPERELSKALEIVQLANVVEPNHRPSVLAKVYSLRGIN